MSIDTKRKIKKSIQAFLDGNLTENALALFDTLGYITSRRSSLVQPNFESFKSAYVDPQTRTFREDKALVNDWKYIDLLFQLSKDEAAQYTSLFDTQQVDNTIIEAYLFFTIELSGKNYTRTELSIITREINRVFPMPVMILFKHGKSLTLSIINRRLHKRDETKDVLEKVTLIKDIGISKTHRAHIEILYDLSFKELQRNHPFTNFVELHNAWQKTLDTKELNKRFFKELANWYFWAVKSVIFPDDAGENEDIRNATSIIRLITRLMFVWFLKEKDLVPDDLFDENKVKNILKFKDQNNSTYYKAILQNLFFATLNTEMGKRRFRKKNNGGRNSHYFIHNVFRYSNLFNDPEGTLTEYFDPIPFLNGGLFECLDKEIDGNGKKNIIRIDGFSDRKDNVIEVPDELFFQEAEKQVDLNQVYGTRNKRYKVRGLLTILHSYKFTVTENTPIEEEIALDPELLGRVFENLLASYNPETKTTARKQTGSFYTPREIVNYMVDESLKAYLKQKLVDEAGMEAEDADIALEFLVSYDEKEHLFSDRQEQVLIDAIDNCKILDPACGSGAFPMGILHKMVHILHQLDPRNEKWKRKQVEKAETIDIPESRDQAIQTIEEAFEHNELNFPRKLYLIENCIHGVDIQPIAVQIAKLRFFISLIVDQKVNMNKENIGIMPLPNLETKFVAANTLIGLNYEDKNLFTNPLIEKKKGELKKVRHSYFDARTRIRKEKCKKQDKQLREDLSQILIDENNLQPETANMIAAWDPYDQNSSASFFDPEWMFGQVSGCDIVIGNPPYVRPHKLSSDLKKELWKRFISFEKKADLYVCFIERGILTLSEFGHLTLIVSNGCLRLDSFEQLRKFLLKNTIIRRIVDFDDNIFESAAVKTCILHLQRSSEENNLVEVAITSTTSQVELLDYRIIPQAKFKENYKSIFDLSSDIFIDTVKNKIKIGSAPLGKLFELSFGLKSGDDSKFISTQALTNQHQKLLRGKDIGRYFVDFRGEYVWYRTELTRAHRKTARPGTKDRFEQPKVLIRDTGDCLMGTFDDAKFYVKDVLIIEHHSRSILLLKKLVALLNSSLMRFYYETSFPTLHVQRGELASLPVKESLLDNSTLKEVPDLVDQILSVKESDMHSDTNSLEREIDQLVYSLYDLTPDEIRIIEGTD